MHIPVAAVLSMLVPEGSSFALSLESGYSSQAVSGEMRIFTIDTLYKQKVIAASLSDTPGMRR